MYEALGYMLTGIRDEGVYWEPRVSNPLLKVHELNNQTSATNGLLDPYVILPPYRLHHFVRHSR